MIVELLGGIRATIFAALAGLLLMVAAVQHVEVRHYKAQAITIQSAVKTFQSAQATNLATIATLKAANQKWADDNAANRANAKAYADAAIEYARQQQAAAESANAKLRALYAQHPAVKAWADSAVPPDVMRVLASTGKD